MCRARTYVLVLAWVLGLVVPGVGAAGAGTFYVDPAGSDAAAGTADAPWQTIQHAGALAAPGDTVIARPGLYVESVTIATSGTPAAPITYQALPGAVLESPNPSRSLSAFNVQAGVGHIALAGFEARGGFHETIFLRHGTHDVTIRNCFLHDNRAGIWVAGATNIEIDNCRIENNTAHGLRLLDGSRNVTVRNTVSAGHDDGRGCLGDADGFTAEETTSNIIFVDCQARGNSEDGFDLQGERMLVLRSRSQDNGCAGIKLDQNARVENFVASGNKTGILTTSFYNLPTAIEIINSTVADNRGTQMHFRQPLTQGAPAMSYRVTLRNVVASGPGKAIEVEPAVELTEDHNVFFREETTSGLIVRHLGETVRRYSGQEINMGVWTADTGQGGGTWAIKPAFADSAAYRPAPESVVIDTGAATGAPLEDIEGAARPQGYQTDAGAYEAQLTLDNHRPWADPGPARTTRINSEVIFTAYGSVDPDGDAITYAWDFGDGSEPAPGYTVTHTYAAGGVYDATLTVADGPLSASRRARVIVEPTPEHLRAQCQETASLALGSFFKKEAACIARCEKAARHSGLPPLDCAPPYAGETAVCVARAAARATKLIRRKCTDHCPECYAGGDYATFAENETANFDAELNTLRAGVYCDDAASADGLTRKEATCQDRVMNSLGKLAADQLLCRRKCRARERRGKVRAGQCAPPAGDAETSACVAKKEMVARRLIDKKCGVTAGDAPECHAGHTGAEWTALSAAVAEEADPRLYCGR